MLPDIPGDEIPPGSGCAGTARADRAGNVKTGKTAELIPAHPSSSQSSPCPQRASSPERHREPPKILEHPQVLEPPQVTPEPCGGVPAALPPPRRRCVSVLEPGTAWDEDEEEEEEEGRIRGVSLRRSGALRSSLDPFRRHSWEPGKDPRGIPGYGQLSRSPELGSSAEQLGGLCRRPRDPRRAPLVHSSDELDSLLSQDEEDEADVRRAQEDARRLPAPRAGPLSRGWSRFKSASLGVIASVPGEDAAEIPPFASQQSLLGGTGSRQRLAGEAGTPPGREGTPLDRTLSFIRRMTGKTKGKDKERMKEGKEKDARYTNGHLFTTISVSGMTMCFACNKSITAKEALVCPTCNVTIHNRCKDTLPNCTKVKQKQQKAALLKNSSALQSVTVPSPDAIRERPNSAIYPSESFAQTLLGPRRGRPSLSLSKSVSTTNISGWLNLGSALGIGGAQWGEPPQSPQPIPDVLVLLMTDVLVFLQEKDQKYTFPMLDKPAVISLQNLIVRDIANQEKGMFLISAAPPEMYEVHAASRDDRNHWMKVIQQAVSLCPSRQDFPLIETETEASLRKLKERMEQHDRQIAALLEDKVGIFADMLALGSGCSEPPAAPRGTPFPGDPARGPRGDLLLHDAIREVECLKEIFTGCTRDRDQNQNQNQNNPPEVESCASPSASNGDSGSINGSLEFRADPDAGQRDGNGNQVPPRGSQEEINQRLVNLYGLLLRLQVHLTHQEVLLELQLPEGLQRPRPRRGSQPAVPVTGAAEPGPGAELALLQRQHGLVQEELSRCRQLCQERAQEAAALESRLRDSERERSRLERELQEARGAPAGPRGRRAAEPRRRSLPAGDALYLSFTPPQLSHASPPAVVPFHAPAFPGSRDELEFRATDPERLREGEDTLDVLLEDEGGLGSRHSPPASPRDFLRMQDIPEEVENSQELKEGDGDS
ncbi:rho guanine nucleotide exchange factor 2 [Haemorhous mexicanus]|uniref:rho guanine nucleotide exchange factor 2 n=1 Tax=Haemorhous mexicanus TaxID=30427 RepID=UPI0028BD8768|nr:rho guanine nucleotide exchange factor 2 [Haemorhous mexicanus]